MKEEGDEENEDSIGHNGIGNFRNSNGSGIFQQNFNGKSSDPIKLPDLKVPNNSKKKSDE